MILFLLYLLYFFIPTLSQTFSTIFKLLLPTLLLCLFFLILFFVSLRPFFLLLYILSFLGNSFLFFFILFPFFLLWSLSLVFILLHDGFYFFPNVVISFSQYFPTSPFSFYYSFPLPSTLSFSLPFLSLLFLFFLSFFKLALLYIFVIFSPLFFNHPLYVFPITFLLFAVLHFLLFLFLVTFLNFYANVDFPNANFYIKDASFDDVTSLKKNVALNSFKDVFLAVGFLLPSFYFTCTFLLTLPHSLYRSFSTPKGVSSFPRVLFQRPFLPSQHLRTFLHSRLRSSHLPLSLHTTSFPFLSRFHSPSSYLTALPNGFLFLLYPLSLFFSYTFCSFSRFFPRRRTKRRLFHVSFLLSRNFFSSSLGWFPFFFFSTFPFSLASFFVVSFFITFLFYC